MVNNKYWQLFLKFLIGIVLNLILEAQIHIFDNFLAISSDLTNCPCALLICGTENLKGETSFLASWMAFYIAFYIAEAQMIGGWGGGIWVKRIDFVSFVVFSRDVQFFEQTSSEWQTILFTRKCRTTKGKQNLLRIKKPQYEL